MVALETIRDFFQKLISKSDPNSEVVFEIKLRCKQHCVPAEHLDQWIASTEMEVDEKLKHPKASLLLKPKPELAYFLDFDSNTQRELADSNICMGVRKQFICIKSCQNIRPLLNSRREWTKKKNPITHHGTCLFSLWKHLLGHRFFWELVNRNITLLSSDKLLYSSPRFVLSHRNAGYSTLKGLEHWCTHFSSVTLET